MVEVLLLIIVFGLFGPVIMLLSRIALGIMVEIVKFVTFYDVWGPKKKGY